MLLNVINILFYGLVHLIKSSIILDRKKSIIPTKIANKKTVIIITHVELISSLLVDHDTFPNSALTSLKKLPIRLNIKLLKSHGRPGGI